MDGPTKPLTSFYYLLSLLDALTILAVDPVTHTVYLATLQAIGTEDVGSPVTWQTRVCGGSRAKGVAVEGGGEA
ncbi:hypothetical protein PJM30_28955, partial [Mycobacterium kansasii]